MDIKLLYVDLFCGAGGTSTGVESATLQNKKCAKVICCVNHDKNAFYFYILTYDEDNSLVLKPFLHYPFS